MRTLVVSTALLLVLLIPADLFAQPTRGRDVTITLARHDIRGSAVNFRHGGLFDILYTGRIRRTGAWAGIAAGSTGFVLGRMGECAVQPDGRCAPSGSFAVLNALTGMELSSGRTFGRFFVGPSLHHGSGATSVGIQSRLAISLPLDELVGLGIMVQATRLPSHSGESLTLWAYGASVTF